MNRATRDKLTARTTPKNATWETPPAIVAKLREDFGPFDLDLTGDIARATEPVWFGPQSPVGKFDALTADWMTYGTTGFSNPPYGSFIPHLLWQARRMQARGFTSTLLLPLRVTRAFRVEILGGASELFFCDKRIAFYEHGRPRWNAEARAKGVLRADTALFDSIIVRFRAGSTDRLQVGVWYVPPHV